MKFRLLSVSMMLALLVLAGCGPSHGIPEEGGNSTAVPGQSPVSAPADVVHSTKEAASAGGSISIQGVRVDFDLGEIAFSGLCTLPDGTCLHTQLFADGEPVAWWPAETCVPIQGGAWEVQVPLPEADVPEALDPAAEWMVRVWQRDDPSVEAVFWFDLVGPPAP